MRNQFLFASLVVVAACGGVDPTASGVFPAEGFTGRSMRVEISGDATEWSGTPGVNFGDGVTVSNVTVASPTSIFADITIAADAAPGLHDVTVTNNGTYTLKSAFDLQSPIEVSFQGDVAQGGIPYFTITNHDFDTPFDITQDSNDEFVNLAITAPTGVTMRVTAATAYQMSGFAFIDTDAMPGNFSVVSGPAMKTTAFNLGATLDITARTPEALSGPVTGMLANVGDSKLYSINVASGPSLVRIGAKSSSSSGAPFAALLPGGKWANAIGATLAVIDDAGTYPVVVFDNGTASGYNFSLSSKAEALTSAAEGNDTTNGTPAGALVASALPFQQTGGTLADANDKDYIKFTLTDAAKVTIITSSSDDETDTAVDVKNAAGTTSVLNPAGPQDGTCFTAFGYPCGETVTTPMLPAGTYTIEISAGDSFDAGYDAYDAIVFVN